MRWESKYEYLEHYGVKGQKHGLRRYQNEDGSLTAEGRDHYGVGDSRRKANIKADPNAEARREKRRAALKKIVVGLGAAAAVGASVAAVKKSTNLRDQLRNEYAKQSSRQKKLAVSDWAKSNNAYIARMKRGGKNLSPGETLFRESGDRRYMQAEKYLKSSRTATRREAVKNYIKHRGKIVVRRV